MEEQAAQGEKQPQTQVHCQHPRRQGSSPEAGQAGNPWPAGAPTSGQLGSWRLQAPRQGGPVNVHADPIPHSTIQETN